MLSLIKDEGHFSWNCVGLYRREKDLQNVSQEKVSKGICYHPFRHLPPKCNVTPGFHFELCILTKQGALRRKHIDLQAFATNISSRFANQVAI